MAGTYRDESSRNRTGSFTNTFHPAQPEKETIMKRIILAFAAIGSLLFLSGCGSNGVRPSDVGMYTGAIVGAAVTKNPWKGAVIGGVVGSMAGGALEEGQRRSQGTYEAGHDGREPGRTDCTSTARRTWENGRPGTERIEETCRSRTSRYGYRSY